VVAVSLIGGVTGGFNNKPAPQNTSQQAAPTAEAPKEFKRTEDAKLPNGVTRFGGHCYGWDIDKERPCDAPYTDVEQIADWEQLLKDNLVHRASPGSQADWEAWQASAAADAQTYDARMEAFIAEEQKQGQQHAAVSQPFLSVFCKPNFKEEESDPKRLERGCNFDRADFQRNYWLALQGDHRAQEGIAYCFAESAVSKAYPWPCHLVVVPNETQMCAWYLVAASSGNPNSPHAAEEYGWVWECDKKPFYERQAILGTATDLFQRIYHRPLPLAR
jgi:hypothetical protein